MTDLMEKAFSQARALPADEQDAIAAIILQEMESERRWSALFADPKSPGLLSRLADEALAEAKAGRARKLDVNER